MKITTSTTVTCIKKNSGYSNPFSLCVCIYVHMTNNFRHFIYHLFLFFSWLYKKSQRTHFEWHKIVFLHQQDESQKAFMMWKEKEKAVVRQLTQELD